MEKNINDAFITIATIIFIIVIATIIFIFVVHAPYINNFFQQIDSEIHSNKQGMVCNLSHQPKK